MSNGLFKGAGKGAATTVIGQRRELRPRQRQVRLVELVAFSEVVAVNDYYGGLVTFLQSYAIGPLSAAGRNRLPLGPHR